MTTTDVSAFVSAEMATRLTGTASAWEEIAFASGPADRAEAEAGVRSAYQAVGLAEPDHIVWLSSPAQGAVAAALLTGGAAVRDTFDSIGLRRVMDEVSAQFSGVGEAGPSVRELVRTGPWERARAEVVATLGVHVWPHAWQLTGARLWPGVHRLVNDIRTGIAASARAASAASTAGAADGGHGGAAAVDDGVDDDVAEAAALLRRATLDAVYGQQDAPWLALFDGLDGLDGDARHVASLDGLMRVARAAGWWWPFERVAVLCERPVSMHRDDLGRLHRATGPALAFADGFALYGWHGMPVPADFGAAMADLTPERIRQEENAELRRVMLEHFGFDRYLTESAATPVQRDAAGVLWRLELPDDEPLAMVEVVNSTPEPDGTSRTYFLRVPPWTRTAQEGVAWTFGLAAGDYRPERET
ncbi:DUF6745 domain-containing protein [Nonomuraea sp. NPDC050022]|uniref:DUF6745 domain-containing protein n=1 Tax=Nonomuraea sp. NPDC050022 TaxID=3364358 RepID=UPI0037ABB3B4